MSSGKDRSQPNEHTVVVLFKPNARLIDLRGTIAKTLSSHLELPRWSIGKDRVDVLTENEERRVFVGFREYGVQVRNTFTKDYFPDFATKFLRCLSEIDEFRKPQTITRVGVRSRFCTPVQKPFGTLKQSVLDRYVNLREDALKCFGDARVVDVGLPLNFEGELGKFNTHCGPMETPQLRQYFSFAEIVPPVGLYFDIDYFKKPTETMAIASISDLVARFAAENWERHSRLRKLILGE